MRHLAALLILILPLPAMAADLPSHVEQCDEMHALSKTQFLCAYGQPYDSKAALYEHGKFTAAPNASYFTRAEKQFRVEDGALWPISSSLALGDGPAVTHIVKFYEDTPDRFNHAYLCDNKGEHCERAPDGHYTQKGSGMKFDVNKGLLQQPDESGYVCSIFSHVGQDQVECVDED